MAAPLDRCLFCGEAITTTDHYQHCDGRQGHIEAQEPDPEPVKPHVPPPPFVPRWDSPTLSAEEAIEVLKRQRKQLILAGREIALEQIKAHGSTYSRQVLDEMHRRGMLTGVSCSDHWLGAIFHGDPRFLWTGETRMVETKGVDPVRGKLRNIHRGRFVKVWTVRS